MTMRALGTCRNQDCGQTDLLWEDGYCSESCREQMTGCPVLGCGCAGRCGVDDDQAGPAQRDDPA